MPRGIIAIRGAERGAGRLEGVLIDLTDVNPVV
jgi:hypothetical protein